MKSTLTRISIPSSPAVTKIRRISAVGSFLLVFSITLDWLVMGAGRSEIGIAGNRDYVNHPRAN